MPEKLFWPKIIRLRVLLPTLLIVIILGVFLFRNAIVGSIINYKLSANEVTAECLEFNLEWNLNTTITQLCLKHPLADIKISDAKLNFWQNTLSIQALSVNHFDNSSATNEIANKDTQPFVMPSFEFLHNLPRLDIKSLVITSPWLNAPLNIQLSQASATNFQLLGAIDAKIALQNGKILADLNWRLADITQYLAKAQKPIDGYSEILDIEAIEQTKIVSKIEFDGNGVQTTNTINLSNTLSLTNCQLPFSATGDISINGKLAELSAAIDLSKLTIAAKLDQCQTLSELPELSKFQELHISIPHVISFQNNSATLAELSLIIPGASQSSLILSNLALSLDSLSSLNYALSLNPDISDNLNLSKLAFSSAGSVAFDGENLQLHSQQNKLEIIDAQVHRYATEPLQAAFDLQFSVANGIKLTGSLQGSQIKLAETKVGQFKSTFKLSGPNLDNLQIQAENSVNNISYSTLPLKAPEQEVKAQENTKSPLKLAIKQITSNIDLQLTNLNKFTAIADTQLNQIAVLNLPFTQISIKHRLQGAITDRAHSSSHDIVLDNMFSARLEQQQKQFQLRLVDQKPGNLKSIIKAINPELKITDGLISANLEGDLDTLVLKGNFQVENIFATFQNYQIKDLKYQNNFIFNSAGLQLAPSKISLESVDVGIPIQHIQASLSAADSLLRLENISGEIFGGRFSFGNIWLDGRDQLTEIELNDIELAKVIELQKQSGIKLTGQIMGSLPINLVKGGVRIESGAVFSQGPGKLRIIDNPAFDSIKAQQAELAFLENMDFTQLSSKVRLQPDGWLFLDFSILGSNPDKKQSLKFNYSHQENILTLLKSLRMANSVQDKIEKSLKEGGKK